MSGDDTDRDTDRDDLPPDLRALDDALRGARDLATETDLAAAARARGARRVGELPALIDLHADEAFAFLKTLLPEPAAREALEDTLVDAARRLRGGQTLDLDDLLLLARTRGVARATLRSTLGEGQELEARAGAELERAPLATAPVDALGRVEARLGVVARPLVRRTTPRCTCCHDTLALDDARLCASCLAPHHEDCFAVHGSCGAPGCGGTRWVRANEPVATPRSRVRPWLMVGVAWFSGGLMAAGILTSPPLWSTTPELPPPKLEPIEPRAATEPRGSPGPSRAIAAIAEIESRMQAMAPDWAAITSRVLAEERLAEALEDRVELRRLRAECEQNLRDEDLYQRAIDIVSVRDVDAYPAAVRLLEQIDRRSRIHVDAQAYVQWIDADLKVRQAQLAYRSGDEKRAFKLLNEALQKEVLGPEARASVRSRRQTWGRVVTAYQRGCELMDDGRTREAQEEFERVVQLEPDGDNRYHQRAVAHLKHLQELDGRSLERTLREGLDALANQQYDLAFRFFGDVSRHPDKQSRDLQTIQDAVVEANRSLRLLRNAQADFTADRSDELLEIYYVTKLLRACLPERDPARDEATKLYQQVLKRLKTLQLISGEVGEDR